MQITSEAGNHKVTRKSQSDQEITKQPGNHKATRKSQSDQEIAKQPGNHKVIGLNFCFASDWFGG